MSRAFVREDDELPEDPVGLPPAVMLPPGAKNFLTPGGARRLGAELEQLVQERPRLAGAQDDPDAKRELQRLDQRIRYLRLSLVSAEVVPIPALPHDHVQFGATVTVRDRQGTESHYRIVGVDEIDLERDWVSWLTPIARALHLARLGDRVTFRTPAGQQELEIVGITYEPDDV